MISPRKTMLAHLPLALLPLFAACATMMGGGGPWPVPIDSVPQGAMVAYKDANVGITPCTVSMNRNGSRVTLKLAGYHDQVVEAGRGANAMIIGNVLFGGIVGLAIDGASGAAVRVSTEPCWVELTPIADPRPGVWVRPSSPDLGVREEEGWIPEGQSQPRQADKPKSVPTRAPAYVEPTPPSATPEGDGWVRHGSGR